MDFLPGWYKKNTEKIFVLQNHLKICARISYTIYFNVVLADMFLFISFFFTCSCIAFIVCAKQRFFLVFALNSMNLSKSPERFKHSQNNSRTYLKFESKLFTGTHYKNYTSLSLVTLQTNRNLFSLAVSNLI